MVHIFASIHIWCQKETYWTNTNIKQKKSRIKIWKIPIFAFWWDPSPSIALPWSLCPCVLLLNFAQVVGFVKVVTWILLSCYMDLSKLIFGFLLGFTWICQCCYMDLSMLLRGFLKVNTWTFQSHFMPCLHCLWNCFLWIFKKEMSKTHWSWEWKCFHFWNWKIPKSLSQLELLHSILWAR